MSFMQQYELGKKLGSGTFSVVKEAVHKKSSQRFAVKCIDKKGLTPEDIEALTAEVEILKAVRLLSLTNKLILFINIKNICIIISIDGSSKYNDSSWFFFRR